MASEVNIMKIIDSISDREVKRILLVGLMVMILQ
jgi:hypothetical protein